jgi:hypothetical protein
MRSRWALSKPFDERMDRSRLTDCKHFDATVGKIPRVAATIELLCALTRRGAVENALHAPGHVTAPCNDRRQGRSTRVAAGLGRAERFCSFVAGRDGVAPSFAVSAPFQAVFRAIQQSFGFVQLLRSGFLGTGVARRADGLAGVAHLLNGRAGTRGERESRDHENSPDASDVSHGGFFNRP